MFYIFSAINTYIINTKLSLDFVLSLPFIFIDYRQLISPNDR